MYLENLYSGSVSKQDMLVNKICFYLQLYIQFLLLRAQMQHVKKELNFSSYIQKKRAKVRFKAVTMIWKYIVEMKSSKCSRIFPWKVYKPIVQGTPFDPFSLWKYRLWNFKSGDIKLERVLPKNQHTERKLLNFENWCSGKLPKNY